MSWFSLGMTCNAILHKGIVQGTPLTVKHIRVGASGRVQQRRVAILKKESDGLFGTIGIEISNQKDVVSGNPRAVNDTHRGKKQKKEKDRQT